MADRVIENDTDLFDAIRADDQQAFRIVFERYWNIVLNSLDPKLIGNRTVPVWGGGWSWETLRNVNYFLQNYQRGGVSPAIADRYVAIARFFKAYFYANRVARYRDKPWYSKPIEATDTQLLAKGRDPRTALALKFRLCLFEGTFRNYHTEFKLPDSDRFLKQAADAAEELIDKRPYGIYSSSPDKSYTNLFHVLTVNATEIILARPYSASLQIFHKVNYYAVSPSFSKPGLEKELANGYRMRWKEGDLLAPQYKGAYFPGAGNYDLDGDGKTDLALYSGSQPSVPGAQFLKLGTDVSLENGTAGGNIVVNSGTSKKFNEDRDYLYPLPTQDLLLTQNLKQNPNW